VGQCFAPLARLKVASLDAREPGFQFCRPGRFAVRIEIIRFQAEQETVRQGSTIILRHLQGAGEKIIENAHYPTAKNIAAFGSLHSMRALAPAARLNLESRMASLCRVSKPKGP
jgi:hypothetical protein